MASQTSKLLAISLIFHLIYAASIFDIYFTSPVVHPSRRYGAFNVIDQLRSEKAAEGGYSALSAQRAPADRLVLIVGDGLRADTLFKEQQSDMLPAWATLPLDPDIALRPKKNWSASNDKKPNADFYAAPHIRRAAVERGTWGISHTRVPTESRPGHVALIAGMYEDVSAVTKGWKQNPIPFDSVFNQSSHTFSFGSPDILPMFATGALPGQVDMKMYGEEAEDFTADASELDLWVLGELRDLFQRAQNDKTLDTQLRAPGTVFFLHLLGLDTTGHTYRPKSQEYVGNLIVVDAIVAEVEKLFADFFGQENARTSYLFTADHGMSNKGNHGDGEPDNTRTPVVAWGSGVREPRKRDSTQAWRAKERDSDDYYSKWGTLDNLRREDVAQADLATLMSSVLGINVPANSEGKLPQAYLDSDQKFAALASLANAAEVLEMYKIKHEARKTRMLSYKPFKGLKGETEDFKGKTELHAITQLIEDGSFIEAVHRSNALIDLAVEGTRYLQTYDWMALVAVVSMGYLGSMVHNAAFLIKHYVLDGDELEKVPKSSPTARLVVWSGTALISSKFVAERSPWTYFLYVLFAAYFWDNIARERHIFGAAIQRASGGTSDSVHYISTRVVPRLVLSLAALELMAFGYLNRLAWSAGFVAVGFLWPAISILPDVKGRHELLFLAWTVLCGITAMYTMGSVDKEESVALLILSGIQFLLAGCACVLWPQHFLGEGWLIGPHHEKGIERTKKTITLQLVVLIVSTWTTASSAWSLQEKKGLPRFNQVVAWAALAVCFTFPFLYGVQVRQHETQLPQNRLAIIIFAFAPVFVLLSLRDEAMFFAHYSALLLIWAKLEGAIHEERSYNERAARPSNGLSAAGGRDKRATTGDGRSLRLEDVRIAIFFLFFLHIGFFGTGNIASISSFYLSPVYRLVPVFDPFLMAALLIVKIMVPFIILASVVQRMCVTPAHPERTNGKMRKQTGQDMAGPPFFGPDSVGGLGMRDAYAIALLACLFTDVLALNFLVMVRTEGSWLEIGQSITHFVMSNLLQVFVLALSAVAHVVVG